ncbi:tRNA (cytosine(34)-C(5))-methyltransferase [Anabrus simplex]|uniref:tRNA (cytosine(34)-C(5))-methyltransferase n=1 Tax=Anabrus simplex TaxID=316456 RepID=UPI0035A36961
MGRRSRHSKHKNFAQRRREKENKWDTPGTRRAYSDIVRENADFETYYKLQKIVPEDEWDVFMTSLREPLPTVFRITASKSESRALLRIIQSEFFKGFLKPVEHSNERDTAEDDVEKETNGTVEPLCLSWYPDGLAWHLKLTRKDIRRSEAYVRLHNFLISETGCGNISRQEAVSMIPPLILDVKPHHKVLDMCAAPGSKTAQLIEMLHAEDGKLPSGLVIANDIDNNRCYMLVHQAKRLNSPCIVITNHDSAVLPNFTVTNEEGKKETMKFDRVLCDVPCSGDGTLRKNADIWLKWNTANGNNLHSVQIRILQRGLEMLAVGGRLVYSTCSLNPVENEAVIHRMLLTAEGAVQLVDASSMLPGLKCVPGLSHWTPASRDLKGYNSFEEVPAQWQTQLRPLMFPPKSEDVDKFGLHKCLRILPHHQDTGGFFVALLEKVKPLPWEAAAKSSSQSSSDVLQEAGETSEEKKLEEDKPLREPQRKKRRIHGYKEDPFVFFTEDEPLWPVIKEFYGIENQLEPTCLLTRCKEGKKKNIYFTSPIVRDIVINNADKIKLINTGVKTFVRCDNRTMKCPFRLAQEGLQSIFPFLGPKRKVIVSTKDLITLLMCEDPKKPPELDTLEEDTQKQFKSIDQGSCVLMYNEVGPGGDAPALNLQMVGWNGTRSVRAYVPVNDCVHYLRLLGADVSKFEVNKFKDRPQTEDTSLKVADSDSCSEMNDSSRAEEEVEEKKGGDGET